MESRKFKADTEKFVRETLSRWSKKPSEKKIRQVTSRLVHAFEPVVSIPARPRAKSEK
jgi:hypothetical protein